MTFVLLVLTIISTFIVFPYFRWSALIRKIRKNQKIEYFLALRMN